MNKDGSWEFEGEPEDVTKCVAALNREKQPKVVKEHLQEVDDEPEQPLPRMRRKIESTTSKIKKLEKAKKLYDAGASIYTAYQKAFKLNYKADSGEIEELRKWIADGTIQKPKEPNNGSKKRMTWIHGRIRRYKRQEGLTYKKAMKKAMKDYSNTFPPSK